MRQRKAVNKQTLYTPHVKPLPDNSSLMYCNGRDAVAYLIDTNVEHWATRLKALGYATQYDSTDHPTFVKGKIYTSVVQNNHFMFRDKEDIDHILRDPTKIQDLLDNDLITIKCWAETDEIHT